MGEKHTSFGTALTERECEVLRRFADGQESPQIAREMNIAERTVKNAQYRAAARLGGKSRSHTVYLAIQSGDLQCGPRRRPSSAELMRAVEALVRGRGAEREAGNADMVHMLGEIVQQLLRVAAHPDIPVRSERAD